MATNSYPAWVAELTDAALVRRFGQDTVDRGADYAEHGRVGRITVGGGGDLIHASVRGSGYRVYQTVLRHTPEAAPERVVSGSCSCPVRFDCKHVAALLLHMRAVRLRRTTPAWQQALQSITSQVAGSSTVTGAPLAIEFTQSGSGVELRPLLWGRSGRWIRTGITWETVDTAWNSEYQSAHRQALAALKRSARRGASGYYYSQRADVLQLRDLRRDLWTLLTDARDVGVAFLPGRATPEVRVLAEAVRPICRLSPSPDGGLVLEGLIDDAGELRRVDRHDLIGDPPHGAVLSDETALRLAPFAEPLSAAQLSLLTVHGSLAIPAADVPGFFGSYYPALARALPVQADGVELPEVPPPVLTLRIGLPGGHAASLAWGFRYGSGTGAVEVSLTTWASDPPIRDVAAEQRLVDDLPDGPWPSSRDHLGRRRLPAEATLAGHAVAELMTAGVASLRAAGVDVQVTGQAPDYREASQPPTISLRLSDAEDEATDWFNLAVTVTVDGVDVPFAELFRALSLGESHLILDDGLWFSLDRPELAQLRRLIQEAQTLTDTPPTSLRLRTEHVGLWEELVTLGVVAEQSTAWSSAAQALLDLDSLPQAPLPDGLHATLRPYQVTGFRWLSFLWQARLGGILADDMGLGKTLQALALVAAAKERGELDRPVLVVAPTSVLGTWVAEAARFTPGLSVTALTQTSRKRTASLADAGAGADLVITTYTLLRLDADEYAALPWSAVLLDEAQFVKNRQARVHQAVRRLRARVKIAMTGTPLENNLMDLWSLLSITAPGLFADPAVFTELYRRPIESGTDPDALARLHRRIRPLMLRRTKDAVAAELPPKQEQVIAVTLTPAHRRLYDKHLNAERRKVLKLVEDLNRNRITILRSLTLLRQLALSPALIDTEQQPGSAKVDTLVEMLTELVAEGHRALVFSQFTTFLGMVRRRLREEQIAASYLDGRTRNREAVIEGFRAGDDPVFLISLKAGGFGLTLTEADYVFILDPWWNPAAETQAIDRTHRIGQDKHVFVYRLVSEDTIEEKVVALQERKRDLFARVVEAADADLAAPLTADDIRGLLEA